MWTVQFQLYATAAVETPHVASPPTASVVADPERVPSRTSALSAIHSSDHKRVLGLADRAEDSSLTAEVAALDAARRALQIDTPDAALTVLQHYRPDFPRGKLAQEAEVTTIEAFAAKGERDRVSKEAARFLDEYPNAPQSARVERLRADAARR